MTKISVEEARTERLVAAFMAGVEAELLEIRGRGLSEAERAEYEREAIALYGEPGREPAPAPVVAA